MKKQQGFTLIELIVVIVILGILAATALPRFANLQGDARAASANAALGSMNSAAALAHGLWLARNQPASAAMEGQVITFDASGYPNAATIAAAAGITATSYAIAANGAGGTRVTPLGSTAGSCSVDYTPSGAVGTPPTIVTVPAPLVPDNC